MEERDVLLQRRLARQQKAAVDFRIVELHRAAVAALAHDEESVLRRAQQQIRKWEVGHLCNAMYVQGWRRILSLPPKERAEAMLREDAQGVAMRQNSPFGFLRKVPYEPEGY